MKIPAQPVTKAGFIAQLTEGQKQAALLHFQSIEPDAAWTQREEALTYLAWLMGEGYLVLADHWMDLYHESVEFDIEDYEKFRPDGEGAKPFHSIEFTRLYYKLPELYNNVLR